MRDSALRISIVLFTLLTVPHPNAGARILYVPADFSTIQGAIDDAAPGDTVRVAPGRYREHRIEFRGKAITVTGSDPLNPDVVAATVVDGDSLGVVFRFWTGEPPGAILTGLTITGGNGIYGGGVYCRDASPTIRHNVIRGNLSTSGGAGICTLRGDVTIADNTIADNTDQFGGGGGIDLEDSGGIVTGNIVSGNRTTDHHGGGIYVSNSTSTVSDNIIVDNEAGEWGGGIACFSSQSPISGNWIAGNRAGERGGGIYYIYYGAPVTDNLIAGNSADYGGGIDVFDEGDPFISRNRILRNVARKGGGGIRARGTSPSIFDNTFQENAADSGGAIFCFNGAAPVVMNSIFRGDSAEVGPEFWVGSADYPSSLTISYSDVEGGQTSAEVTPNSILDWGAGMIEDDPRFVLPERGDVRLLWGSPCIDAAHPISIDPDRTRGDIGAVYFDQRDSVTLYLTPDTSLVAPGDSLGVTYTLINRWTRPMTFGLLTRVSPPSGPPVDLVGPLTVALPAETTARQRVVHEVPGIAPAGLYAYESWVGLPPATLYGGDRFIAGVFARSGR